MTAPVALETLPETVYLERSAVGQALNLDLRFTNEGPEPWRLVALTISVYDDSNRLVLRRTLDEHGLSPPIETIPDRVVPAGGSLLVFNPFHSFSAGLRLGRVAYSCTLEAGVHTRTLKAEVRPRPYEQQVGLVVPLAGRVLVAAGHDFLSPHRRIDPSHPLAVQVGLTANSGRFADDFSLVDEDGRLFEGDATNLETWVGFGAPVRAPGAGTVVAALGDVPDNRFTDSGVVFAEGPPDPTAVIFGNHVVVDHGAGEFSVLGHLQHGSVEAQPGDRIERGQSIARLGLSGNTDFVHLHYQLQTGPDARTAEGLPATFEDAGGPLEPGTLRLIR